MLLSPMNPLGRPHFDHHHVNTSAALSLTLPAVGAFPSATSSLHMPASKRPKLSLQTTSLTTSYGSTANATGKKATEMSVATPTTLNTFNNTFDLTIRPSPSSATASPFRAQPVATSSPMRRKQPAYSLNLPLGVKPILKNSRLLSEFRRSSLPASSASPRTGRRMFFPAPKKVSFQHDDEEIVTHTYVAHHVDLSANGDEDAAFTSDSGSDPCSSPEPSEVESETDDGVLVSDDDETRPARVRVSSPRVGRGRSRQDRSTSNQRTKKKRRRWEWTVDEVEEGESPAKKVSPAKEVDIEEELIQNIAVEQVEAAVEEAAGESIPVERVEEATIQDIAQIAASTPLPPDRNTETETSKSKSQVGHVLAMVKRFEDFSSDRKEPCM